MHQLTTSEHATPASMAAHPIFLLSSASEGPRRDRFPQLDLTGANDDEVLLAAAAVSAAREHGYHGGFERGMRWGLALGFLSGSIAVAAALYVGFHS